jgi:hypothetical protein
MWLFTDFVVEYVIHCVVYRVYGSPVCGISGKACGTREVIGSDKETMENAGDDEVPGFITLRPMIPFALHTYTPFLNREGHPRILGLASPPHELQYACPQYGDENW